MFYYSTVASAKKNFDELIHDVSIKKQHIYIEKEEGGGIIAVLLSEDEYEKMKAVDMKLYEIKEIIEREHHRFR